MPRKSQHRKKALLALSHLEYVAEAPLERGNTVNSETALSKAYKMHGITANQFTNGIGNNAELKKRKARVVKKFNSYRHKKVKAVISSLEKFAKAPVTHDVLHASIGANRAIKAAGFSSSKDFDSAMRGASKLQSDGGVKVTLRDECVAAREKLTRSADRVARRRIVSVIDNFVAVMRDPSLREGKSYKKALGMVFDDLGIESFWFRNNLKRFPDLKKKHEDLEARYYRHSYKHLVSLLEEVYNNSEQYGVKTKTGAYQVVGSLQGHSSSAFRQLITFIDKRAGEDDKFYIGLKSRLDKLPKLMTLKEFTRERGKKWYADLPAGVKGKVNKYMSMSLNAKPEKKEHYRRMALKTGWNWHKENKTSLVRGR